MAKIFIVYWEKWPKLWLSTDREGKSIDYWQKGQTPICHYMTTIYTLIVLLVTLLVAIITILYSLLYSYSLHSIRIVIWVNTQVNIKCYCLHCTVVPVMRSRFPPTMTVLLLQSIHVIRVWLPVVCLVVSAIPMTYIMQYYSRVLSNTSMLQTFTLGDVLQMWSVVAEIDYSS